MAKFEIKIPELKINEEQRQREMRTLLKEDFEKGGVLSQSLVFTYLNQPASTTEITESISKYYQKLYDRATIFRSLQKLVALGLLHQITSGVVLFLPKNERKPIHDEISTKYHKFIQAIPEAFRKNFTDVNFFWVANGEGEGYIEWCCKILGFVCDIRK